MEVTIGIYGMTCGHCQKRVADAISSLEGVGSVEVDLETEHATVSFNPVSFNPQFFVGYKQAFLVEISVFDVKN
jgi:P-type Cu+ transporter